MHFALGPKSLLILFIWLFHINKSMQKSFEKQITNTNYYLLIFIYNYFNTLILKQQFKSI